MLSINKNLPLVKKGMLDAIKLFKIQYLNNKNIVLCSNKKIYINNIDQLLQQSPLKDKNYTFGFNFVLENIKNFRDNICVNPILYLLSLEIIIKSLENTSHLNEFKNKFNEINNFLNSYYKTSLLSHVDLKVSDIENIFEDILSDDFLKQVVYSTIKKSNLEVIESKENKIVEDNYYRLRSNHICGPVLKDNCRITVGYELNKDFYRFVCNQIYPTIIFCNKINFEIDKYNCNQNITIIKVPYSLMLSRIQDIIKLSKCNIEFFDLCKNFNDYIFGSCKEFKFFEGVTYLSFKEYCKENAKEIQHLKYNDTLKRYYMMQGKNIIIYCIEEYLERVRCLVTFIKCILQNGIFYNETKTLKLILYFFKQDKTISYFIQKLLIEYLKLFGINLVKIDEIINNEDLKLNYNPKLDKYTNENLFTCLDIYLNTFGLLNSNIELLRKVC
jgi:hypothetical protein